MNQPLPLCAVPEDDEALGAALRASRVLVDAPETLICRVVAQGAPAALPLRRPVAQALAGAVRQLVACLLFDSAGQGALATGRRSAPPMGTGAARQLLFAAEGHDVDLRLAPLDGGQRWLVSGQVLGPELVGRAELRQAAASAGDAQPAIPPVQAVAWNEFAEFEFDPLPPGDYLLSLSGSAWTVHLPLSLMRPQP
ncbi:hypothetical protein [Rubrivivax rivuli]|uniref:Uncharacterized protein n=1 Tax=Rubrivivax rivuli TaxID=1862385 RepID=A0A437RE85_9BURK|nr:hypothetical protein [Rubrivivax rivuli]RVU45071.1 hypothetical protein EOE66_12990 [Rubrivivax rivuli]